MSHLVTSCDDVGWEELDIPCEARCGKRVVLQYGKVNKVQCCGYLHELAPTQINLFVYKADVDQWAACGAAEVEGGK